jgi:hypothetical protein
VVPGQLSGLETEKQEFVFLKLFSCLVPDSLIKPNKKEGKMARKVQSSKKANRQSRRDAKDEALQEHQENQKLLAELLVQESVYDPDYDDGWPYHDHVARPDVCYDECDYGMYSSDIYFDE